MSNASPSAERSAGPSATANSTPSTHYYSEIGGADAYSEQLFLFPPSGRSSCASSVPNTPITSRPPSPLVLQSRHSSSCDDDDDDDEPVAPLLRSSYRSPFSSDDTRRWWAIAALSSSSSSSSSRHRRRRRHGAYVRSLKKLFRRILRHPLFPRQPITIVLTLLLLTVFATFLTLLLIYILNPDKEPLPWRAYCSVPSSNTPPDINMPTTSYPLPLPMSGSGPGSGTPGTSIPPFPPPDFDSLPPVGVLVGIFSMDSAFERRMLVRTSWASHIRSREGAGNGDGGKATSRTVVRFIVGLPRREWERRIKLESHMYNDIVILPIAENMNSGKTHAFFTWASENAWVPPIYFDTPLPPPPLTYANETWGAPPLAPHDPKLARRDAKAKGETRPWVRPDFVAKVDDDSFVMLAELEARLRVELNAKVRRGSQEEYHTAPPNVTTTAYLTSSAVPRDLRPAQSQAHARDVENDDPLVYWGYLVKNRFMAGELYALSWSLVDWVARNPVVKTLTRGAEDKQTAKWMRLHPRAGEVRWTSERCWMYDHPRAGTVYSHGFLFPSEVTRVRRNIASYLGKGPQDIVGTQYSPSPSSWISPSAGTTTATPAAWAYSSVSTFGTRYTPPLAGLNTLQSVEALVEGSAMSIIREGSPMSPGYAWDHREGRRKKYEGKRVGGTVVVHFIKKNAWFLETAMAFLEGEEYSEAEKFLREKHNS